MGKQNWQSLDLSLVHANTCTHSSCSSSLLLWCEHSYHANTCTHSSCSSSLLLWCEHSYHANTCTHFSPSSSSSPLTTHTSSLVQTQDKPVSYHNNHQTGQLCYHDNNHTQVSYRLNFSVFSSIQGECKYHVAMCVLMSCIVRSTQVM